MDAERTPVVIASGQTLERDAYVTPLDLAERAASIALDTGHHGGGALRDRIERVSVVNMLSPGGPSPASILASRLGLRGATRSETTTVGGNTPQWLVTRAARDIAAGDLSGATLILGAETMRSARAKPTFPPPADGVAPDRIVGEDRPGIGPAETAVGVLAPAHLYPLFESVLAARAGRSFAEQRAFLGRLLAPFTEVAAKHPHAWFTEPRTAEDLGEPSPSNRLVTEPYTKLMNAFLGGDQAAAIVVTSLAVARELGVADGAVFVWSGADAIDVWFPSARPDLGASPGIAAAGRAALDAAGATVEDVAAFDLYSCFPSAVQMGAAALGLALDDARGLTVTGGLPYFGGPGNNYTTHAIATMVDRLRAEPGTGLVTGLGWYVTKHSVGVYGSTPPPNGFRAGDTSDVQRAIDASALDVVVGEVLDHGATVDASTVIYTPTGDVQSAPAIATLDDGRRVVATAAPDDRAAAAENLVGRRVHVTGWPPTYKVVR
jgi:acetyl-CoA C-acetyltransferase